MSKFTIVFSGICTHFKGVVSGVPHRVVLPDAALVLTGFITIPPQTDPVFYYLTPHFAHIHVQRATPDHRDEPSTSDLTIPNLISQGRMTGGLRLQVINARDTRMDWKDKTPSLSDFAPNYNFSSDVVLNGRAACYVDIYGGKVTTLPADPPYRTTRVAIEMETDGVPELLITPLVAPSTGESHRIRLAEPGAPDVELHVSNLETFQEEFVEDGFGQFDYLLHYLTARGGIPQTIVQPTPGLSLPLPQTSAKGVGVALQLLGDMLIDTPSRHEASFVKVPFDAGSGAMLLTPSCSDSQYP
jgi:hypothetical protein